MPRRCAATTKKGKPCQNMVEWGMDVCGPHRSQRGQSYERGVAQSVVREQSTHEQIPWERTTVRKLMAELEASIARARAQR